MASIELYKQDGSAAGVFYCSECLLVYNNKEQAECCHGDGLCACGKKVTHGYPRKQCSDCYVAEWREQYRLQESERFDKATKISPFEYTGTYVYYGDKYYPSIEGAIDGCLEGEEPEYVWACKDIGVPKVDLEGVLCNVIDSMWEDADYCDLNGVDELESALNAFNKANESVSVYHPDYTTAILVREMDKEK